eukprot:6098168-Pyramimonas_sp.AAC.1
MKFLKVGVPVCWLKLVYNTWRPPRVIRLGKHHYVTPLVAVCGLHARDGYNDLAIKVRAYEEFDEYMSRCPAIDFLNYIDDTALSNGAKYEEIAVKVSVHAMVEFRRTYDKLSAGFNSDKIGLLASTPKLGHA